MSPWRKSGAGSGCDPPRRFPPCRRYEPRQPRQCEALKDRPGELRLRVGKWRVFFCLEPPDFIRVLGIDSRGEAY